MTFDLFGGDVPRQSARDDLADGAVLLRGQALDAANDFVAAIRDIAAISPFRNVVTPGGHLMSVAMTNCVRAGWVADCGGSRYDGIDPKTGRLWPEMPYCFMTLAVDAAQATGCPGFRPDACLINGYAPGARLSLQQDRNERDMDNPIVSVSLVLPVTFQFGGVKRTDPVRKYPLLHGDVAVWGGPSRLCYHGVLALKDGEHPTVGRVRFNLTFRGAL